MELNRPVNVGKYEAALLINSRELANDYLETCIEETMHAGFDRKTAEKIERENILNFAKNYDKFTQRRIMALFGKS